MYARTVITSPTDELVFICSEVVISSFHPLTFQLPLALFLEEIMKNHVFFNASLILECFLKKANALLVKYIDTVEEDVSIVI